MFSFEEFDPSYFEIYSVVLILFFCLLFMAGLLGFKHQKHVLVDSCGKVYMKPFFHGAEHIADLVFIYMIFDKGELPALLYLSICNINFCYKVLSP